MYMMEYLVLVSKPAELFSDTDLNCTSLCRNSSLHSKSELVILSFNGLLSVSLKNCFLVFRSEKSTGGWIYSVN